MAHEPGCSCAAESKECGESHNLYKMINTPCILCLNEHEPDAGRNPFKPWEKRHDKTKVLRNNEDTEPEVIIKVPFTCEVKLDSICIIGEGQMAPTHIKVWTNREDIDFGTAEDTKPYMEFDLAEQGGEHHWYKFKSGKHFSNVSSLIIFLNHEGDEEDPLQINYIGLRGLGSQNKREVIKGVVYEARALPDNLETKADENVSRSIQ